MALVLPSTVEEINLLQSTPEQATQAFENIIVEKKLKREISLPNGLENWNISNYDPYLHFEDNEMEMLGSPDDRLVPEDGNQRGRCASISSVTSSVDDKPLSTQQSFAVKTFNTVCVDSGSTCIADHSYVSSNPILLKGLDPEETYQNLDTFLQEVPDMSNTDVLSSPFSPVASTNSSDSFELTVLHGSLKRKVCSDVDVFAWKRAKQEFEGGDCYYESRRKNNIASKNCRKTRKEKQKEMESRVNDLEKEKESLKVKVQVLEELIQAHKAQLYAILQKR